MTKTEALRIIHRGALQYQANLVNRNVLFVTLDKNKKIELFEVSFLPRNFLHLTGTQTKLSSVAFYSMACRDRLSDRDISFASDGTTEKKLDVLITAKNLHFAFS